MGKNNKTAALLELYSYFLIYIYYYIYIYKKKKKNIQKEKEKIWSSKSCLNTENWIKLRSNFDYLIVLI